MKQIQKFITEQKFGYTWENAFICAIKCIDDKEKAKGIMKKWFGDKDNTWSLYVFLKRMDHEPKSESIDDIYNAMMSITMNNNYYLK